MASSSSTHRVKTPDKQQNEWDQTLETAHKSKFITPTSTSEHIKEKSEKRDQSSKFSLRLIQKHLNSHFAASSVQSNFIPLSRKGLHHRLRSPVAHARPFDEFAVGPLNPDGQSTTDTKPDNIRSPKIHKKS